MDVIEEIVETQSDGSLMSILRKRPAGDSNVPKVIMFHDGPGIRSATHEFATKLAREGFDVIVPDLYHRHGQMLGWELDERAADPTILDRLAELLGSLTDAGVQQDLDATLPAVGVLDNERLATIGFCVGARAVFRTMSQFPDRFVAGAMWHPSFLVDDKPDSPHLTASELSAPLFVGIGEDDQIQPVSLLQPFVDAVGMLTNVHVSIFPETDHGYTWPGWPNYNEAAATESFEATLELIHAEFAST